MKRATILLFTVLMLGVIPAMAQNPKGESPNAAKITEEANAALQLFVQEEYDTLFSRLTESAQKDLPPQKLREFWRSIVAEAGQFQKVLKSEVKEGAKNSVVYLKCQFERGNLFFRFGVNSEHKIGGFTVDSQ